MRKIITSIAIILFAAPALADMKLVKTVELGFHECQTAVLLAATRGGHELKTMEHNHAKKLEEVAFLKNGKHIMTVICQDGYQYVYIKK